MPIINRIGEFHDELTAWRRELHMYPETAFEEKRTAAFVAGKLEGFGVDEIHTGIAGTGVVAVLRAGDGRRSVALRADMDALDIEEANDFPHRSRNPGKMHACGHDGHTTMLLGAARYLTETRNFDGTVYFVFQPAEENEGGARVMVEEGLFDRFPADAVYAMHNSPGVPVGHYAVQLAKWAGARVLATVSGEAKARHALAGGADAVINYRAENVVERVRELTGGEGVDRIVEVDFGGNLVACTGCLKRNGAIAIYASDGNVAPEINVRSLMALNATLRFVVLNSIPLLARRRAQREVTEWARDPSRAIPVAATYPLDGIVAAHELVESLDKLGTVVVGIRSAGNAAA